MSGGGGGIVIIKSLRAALSDPRVSGELPIDMHARLLDILAKDEGDCTPRDVRFMLRCIGEAFENC